MAGRSPTSSCTTAATSIPTRCSRAAIRRRCSTSCTRFRPISAASALPLNSATATLRRRRRRCRHDQSVIHQGWWFIHKELEHFNNDLRLSKELFDGNTLTIGLYTRLLQMDDEWALGNQMMMTNTPNARPITVSFHGRRSDRSTRRTSRVSSTTAASTSRRRGHAFNKALYLSDSWRIDKWLLDASVRYENQEATNRVCNLTNVDLDGNPLTLYNNSVPVCNGTLAVTDYDEDFTSWTVGANYSFTDSMSAYVRVNRGGHFLDFDNGIRGSHHRQHRRPCSPSATTKSASSSRTTCSMPTSAPTSATSPVLRTADRRERRAGPAATLVLWLRVEGRQFHRLRSRRATLPLPKWSPTTWTASTRTSTPASRTPTSSPATAARRSKGSNCSASRSCATC